ncbi:uncharacterized protein LOC126456667 [Schistocerca serialis cubense]|uniref:uncharacterized protein LOC126456667 n=1 Tax=Schistocerca serialis cubense TaxID=2023355 RepID=UPI00214ED20B|nr:uncharacterized protein LOC126456667 [Schistocerca serialis cubense]
MPSDTLVPLPALIDFALGTPEIGAVNFNILHSVLHVIVQQTNLYETQVEFKGHDADRLETLVKQSSPRPSVRLQEYQLPVVSFKKSKEGIAKVKEETTSKEDISEAKEETQADEQHSETELQTVVLVESFGAEESPETEEHGPRPSKTASHKAPRPSTAARTSEQGVIIRKGSFERLERKVSKIQAELKKLDALPTNEDLIRRSRVSSDSTPVKDMWQFLNLTKRLDAVEEGIERLTSVLQDIAKQIGLSTILGEVESVGSRSGSTVTNPLEIKDEGELRERLVHIEKRLWEVEHRMNSSDLRIRASRSDERRATGEKRGTAVDYEGLSTDEAVSVMKGELTTVQAEMDALMQELRQHITATGE